MIFLAESTGSRKTQTGREVRKDWIKIPLFPRNSRPERKEKRMEMKIRDLYEGAYLLCMGFHLQQLTIVDGRGKPKAVFVIVGDGIEEKAEAYRTGQATVNVAMLKFTLEKLKDAMFAKMREQGCRHPSNGEQEKEKRRRICDGQGTVPAYQAVS